MDESPSSRRWEQCPRDAGVFDSDSMVRHEINGNFSDSSNRYSEGGIKSCARRRRSDCVCV